jgi:diaminopimelate decarboxylase
MGQGILMPNGSEVESVPDTSALMAEAGLSRVGSSLHMGGVPLTRVGEAVGTPTYVYNAEVVRDRYRRLSAAFAGIPHRICYAVKANSSLAILRLLRDLGAGADLVSAGEMHRAVAAGFSPEHLVFSGVGKTTPELRQAIEAGVGQINVESQEELARLGDVAEELDCPVSLGLRVNPDITTATHPYIATGDSSAKFGIPMDQVLAAGSYIHRHPKLTLSCLAMHLGSQLVDVAPYVRGVTSLLEINDALRRGGIDTVEVADVGGGFGIPYDGASGGGIDIDAVGEALGSLLQPTALTMVLEPGRFLVGNAGVLLSEVQYRKYAGGKTFLILDSGMNDLLRPVLYRTYHHILELEAQGRREEDVDVVGPACETGDYLALGRRLPVVETGERLAVLGAGAYGFVMSSNYNSRPRAAEVLVDGSRFGVARQRESVPDLLRGETTEPLSCG